MKPSNPILVSAVVVAKSPDGLGETLRSVRQLAEEVVVIDVGSDALVAELARGYEAHVTSEPWSGDLAPHWRSGRALARGQWVLCVEGGEHLVETEVKRVRDALAEDAVSTAMRCRVIRCADHLARVSLLEVRLTRGMVEVDPVGSGPVPPLCALTLAPVAGLQSALLLSPPPSESRLVVEAAEWLGGPWIRVS